MRRGERVFIRDTIGGSIDFEKSRIQRLRGSALTVDSGFGSFGKQGARISKPFCQDQGLGFRVEG